MAPWYRRSQRTTIGEIIEDRYGRGLALVYTVFAIAFFVFNQGAMLKGAGKVIAAATGGQVISANEVVLVMAGTFILYSFFGGLIAAAYTDFVQGFLIIALSFMLLPTGLAAVGGFRGLHAALPANFLEVYNDQSGVNAFTIAMLTLNGLVGITAMPHMVSMYATGQNERAGRVGMTYGNFVKRFCTIGWALTGLIVAVLVLRQGTKLADAEDAFGYGCRHLLGPGWVGLMVSCILAANMSTCSNFMVNTGALFTRNVYQVYFRPEAGDREQLRVGRLSGLLLTSLGVIFALKVDQVLQAFLFTETIAALMGIMFLGGLLWRRANRCGAWAATVVAFAMYYCLHYLAAGNEWKLVYKWTPDWFGWAMLYGFGALVVGSYLTRPEDAARLDAFFQRMRRSTDSTEPPDDRSDPAAAERGQDLLLLDLGGWLSRSRWQAFGRRYREDLIGFALACGVVVLLIVLAWELTRIGG
jgi:Na+/proline symporter